MTDSRKERKEDMTDHWWNIHTKICSLKAETENEKETHIHWSRSLRARGLKYDIQTRKNHSLKSRSLRARGLKWHYRYGVGSYNLCGHFLNCPHFT